MQKTTKSKTFLNIPGLKYYILYTLNSYLNTRNAGHVVHTFHLSIYRRQRLAWSTKVTSSLAKVMSQEVKLGVIWHFQL